MGKNKSVLHLIDREWCKGCGICIHFCPKDVLEFDADGKAAAVRPEDCIACQLCELRCPDLAIQVVEQESAPAAAPQGEGGEEK